MRQQTQPPVGSNRDEFCAYLRTRRSKAEISLDEIAQVTRIPVHSLEHLEQGRFEDLPADVFVRGFLRSYARCIGFDADATIRAYASCGLAPAPVSSEMADEVLRSMPSDAGAPGRGEAVRSVPAPTQPEPATEDSAAASAEPATEDSAAASAEPATEDSAAASAEPATEASQEQPEETVAAVANSTAPRKRSPRRRRRRRSHSRSSATSSGTASGKGQPASVRSAKSEAADSVETRGAERPVRREHSVPVVESNPAPVERVAEVVAEPVARPKRQRTFLPPSFGEEEAGRRGPLTLAVIILVIIATLTMSYLLRRPGSSADGYTAIPAQSDDTRA